MSDTANEQQWKSRLFVRLDYLKEVMSVQAGKSVKSILEIADITEKLGVHPDVVKSIRNLASTITYIKDGLANTVVMIKNIKGGDDDSH